ncbi:BZIP transcription factor JlbA/IDI-4 [Colletotrichum sojae]|uniref:BZIP transcription factor JlbA/IDI-4 n=1 Tax=Colletotrichum sojae TaxID=2175907 RepID=A0A8H6J8Y7_9PEZI|nr:BZIP transcription factor JlbA/IDI-4 [Colletotrichum sojae]
MFTWQGDANLAIEDLDRSVELPLDPILDTETLSRLSGSLGMDVARSGLTGYGDQRYLQRPQASAPTGSTSTAHSDTLLSDFGRSGSEEAPLAEPIVTQTTIRDKPNPRAKRKAVPSDEEEPTSDTLAKRQRNTIAARRYRQKGRDRIAELEVSLKSVQEERDQLKLQLARKEAEVDALREMLRK